MHVLQTLAEVLGFQVEQLVSQRATIDELAATVEGHELRLEVFRHLVDADASPTLVLDPPSLRVLYANRAATQLTGTAREDLIGRPPWEADPCWPRGDLVDRLDALRQSFLSAVSHELRTPLTTVVGALETVCAGRVPPDGQRPLLERALVNAGRLNRLLVDLLDLNRSSHGALDGGRNGSASTRSCAGPSTRSRWTTVPSTWTWRR